MKVKLQAGAEMDLLTREEVRAELQAHGAWRGEIARGVKFRDFSGQGTVTGAVWSIGGDTPNNDKDPLGPQAGFVWAVTRIAVSGNGFVPGTDLFSVYKDSISATKLIVSGLTRGTTWDVPTLVLNSNQVLALTGAGTGLTGTDVFVSGQAVELPVQLAWQLL